MLEPISTAAAMAIAKLAFKKFVESGAGELGKKLTDGATAKLMALGNAVFEKMKGNKTAVAVLDEAAEEKPEAEQKLANYLNSLFQQDEAFAGKVKDLANDLHFELTQIEDNSSMTMNVSGNGVGWQNKISGGTVNQAKEITINNHGKNED